VVQCTSAAVEKRRVYRIGLEFVSVPPAVRDRLADVLKSAAATPPLDQQAKPPA
jgi:hypothetical protein